ncbi:hypothetical protein ACFW21_10030 [Streptomyces albogriseolus]|uniref:Rv1733c family protein n=1 Tax=Streptomyces TaxID=1883 RepID=UPI001430B223|nr:hypothetical protein [Streptomyces sp. 2BBP-J2]NIL54889.1 hypothetical protein [Streptomyces sp. 2BBP-J2]
MSARNPRPSGPLPPHREHTPGTANPLRRPSDRFESWFGCFLLLVLALGLPAVALGAGRTAYHSGMHTVQTQLAERHQVNASVESITENIGATAKEQASIRWTDDDGTVRTGSTPVKSDTREGATVRVWVTGDGDVTGPPMTKEQAVTTGWFAGGAAAVGVASALYVARVGVRHTLDRRRYTQWDAEWEQVEPLWAGRFPR